MKSLLIAGLALAALSLPAHAQGRAGGTSAGGPARVGSPGQIGGGVPGSQPNVLEQRIMERKAAMTAADAAPAPKAKRPRKRKAM